MGIVVAMGAPAGLSNRVSGIATPAPVKGNATLGRAVFKASGCGVCHTLKAAGATGGIARKNLDKVKLSYAMIVSAVRNGATTSYGAAMSPFKDTLTPAQVQNVAAFIYKSEHP